MNLSDLMRSRVCDVDGIDLGKIADVRLVQDGPMLLPFGAAFRVEGFVAGRQSIAARFGYHRGTLERPRLLRALLLALERRANFVAWEDVESWDGKIVRLTKRPTSSVRRKAEYVAVGCPRPR